MSFKSELLPELVNQIHMDLHSAGDGQVTEKGRVHEAFQGLVGSSWIPEVADEQIAIGALQRLHQIALFIQWKIGEKP